MKFYKVKPEFDGVGVYKVRRYGQIYLANSLIGNELYTEKELHKLLCGATLNGRGVKDDTIIFDTVEISKRNTFWNFGCRFECRRENVA